LCQSTDWLNRRNWQRAGAQNPFLAGRETSNFSISEGAPIVSSGIPAGAIAFCFLGSSAQPFTTLVSQADYPFYRKRSYRALEAPRRFGL